MCQMFLLFIFCHFNLFRISIFEFRIYYVMLSKDFPMDTIFQLLIISVSLALDSFSVSIAGGVRSRGSKILNGLKVAFYFGFSQAVMPLIGWSIGEILKNFIMAVDHWIAFGLLSFIGVKMIREAINKDVKIEKDILKNKTLFYLAVATSIDALIVGVTLGLFKVPLVISVSVIGIVTFILSLTGYLFGRKLGTLFGKKVEIAGGLALIAIGTKILITHLFG